MYRLGCVRSGKIGVRSKSHGREEVVKELFRKNFLFFGYASVVRVVLSLFRTNSESSLIRLDSKKMRFSRFH